ncbi:MAG: hypothetical protein F4112_16025 [Holophagales bacterium]|nr:hypothetical protein [Holophagales bacterium]MYB20852.1 hypothetical protein [Holophagales bacterium]MYH25492.1 hypothetical protein [Holophagales bacterium]MYI34456.1 hypothetical protein [Holophagales bacterium]
MARIHILRPGKFRDLKGREVNLTQQDMERMAAGYERNSAPVIVGHKDDPEDPAHGWAASLSADARGLWAEVPRLTKQMREWISEGRYRKVSAKLLRKAGGWGVAHIGMLGARQPAVSGLDPVELAAGDEPGDVIFGEVELAALSAGKHETDDDDENNGNGGALALASRALNLARDVLSGRGVAEPPDETGGSRMTDTGTSAGRQGDDLKAQLAAEREAREALQKEVDELKLARKRSKASGAVKAAVKAGRLLPRDEEPMTALLAALADVEVDGEPFTVELAAAGDDGEDRTLSGAEYLGDLLGRLAVNVPQGEISGRAPGEVSSPTLAAPPSEAILARQKVADRAQALMRENKDLSLADAQVQAAVELAGPAS